MMHSWQLQAERSEARNGIGPTPPRSHIPGESPSTWNLHSTTTDQVRGHGDSGRHALGPPHAAPPCGTEVNRLTYRHGSPELGFCC